MEYILQLVSDFDMFSVLDEFLGYNQILMVEQDRLKTTLRTKWGTYGYRSIPFGLTNEDTTFQMDMDISLKGLIHQSVVVYLDDAIVYSNKRKHHPRHLKQIFEQYKRYNMSLNPKKTIFVVSEGILLGHVISKDGILVDPERTKAIM
jgi:hypothetical protein